MEAELRARENEVRELRDELHRMEAINGGLLREMQVVRPEASSAKVTSELAAHTFQIKEVVLGRQTSGIDDDNIPGDEALQVVIEPRDADGHSLKAPGSVQITALEIQPQGMKTHLSTWDVSSDQLRRSWKSGLLSTGYYLVLPWKTPPSMAKLRVVARFMLADGRAFEADKDVTIRLGKIRKAPPLPAPAPEEVLPMPRRMGSVFPPESQNPTPPAPPRADARGSPLPTPIATGNPAPIEPVGLWQPAPPARQFGAAEILPPTRQ